MVNTVLGPVTNFLQYAIDKMNSISMIAYAGLNLDSYLGPIESMGPAWVAMVTSLIAALLLIVIVFVARQVYDLWLAFVNGTMWWF
jgi:hypothetical protein